MSYHIAFIGLGIMGRPMALNLIKAGHRLTVYARRKAALKPLLNAGAAASDSPAEAAREADFVITMVADTPDVEEVILKQDAGVIYGARAGTLVIDMSSISPLATRAIAERLAEKQIAMLDAPVSGGDTGAIEGSLSIMVGGKRADFDRALPVLQILGNTIVHIGDNGAGQVAKACNQIVIAQTMVGVAEAYEFARATGVNPTPIRDALLGGFAYSRILELHGKRMLDEDYKPGFKASLLLKDMDNIETVAEQLKLNLTGAKQARGYLRELTEQGDGDMDAAAIAKAVSRHARINHG